MGSKLPFSLVGELFPVRAVCGTDGDGVLQVASISVNLTCTILDVHTFIYMQQKPDNLHSLDFMNFQFKQCYAF